MEFRIADNLTAALARLQAAEQKAAKITAYDMHVNPAREHVDWGTVWNGSRRPRRCPAGGRGAAREPGLDGDARDSTSHRTRDTLHILDKQDNLDYL